jgi:hypothetical protein
MSEEYGMGKLKGVESTGTGQARSVGYAVGLESAGCDEQLRSAIENVRSLGDNARKRRTYVE